MTFSTTNMYNVIKPVAHNRRESSLTHAVNSTKTSGHWDMMS